MANKLTVPLDNQYVRVTMFMQGSDKQISETHWINVTNGALSANAPLAKKLADLRTAILSGDVTLNETRISFEKVMGDSLVYDDHAEDQPTGLETQNHGNDCLKIRYEGTSLYRRIGYLGCIPDPIIKAGRYQFANAGQWGKDLDSYLKYLATDGKKEQNTWGFIVLQKDPTIAPLVDIVKVSGTANSALLTVETKDAHLLAKNSIVRFYRWPFASPNFPLNQLWNVTSVADGTHFTIALDSPLVNDVTFTAGGKCRKQIKTFQAYTSYHVDNNAVTRKRGGRTFLPRGRSKRKNTVGY